MDLGFIELEPPGQRLEHWEYKREVCKRRNEVEELFRGLTGDRRICTRFEKLDRMLFCFICFGLIFDE